MIICYLYSWHIVQSSLMFDVLHLLLERFSAKVGSDSLYTLITEILSGRTTDRDRLDQLWYDAQVKTV